MNDWLNNLVQLAPVAEKQEPAKTDWLKGVELTNRQRQAADLIYGLSRKMNPKPASPLIRPVLDQQGVSKITLASPQQLEEIIKGLEQLHRDHDNG